MDNMFNNDPILTGLQRKQSSTIDDYRRKMEMPPTRTPIWDRIDAEVAAMTEDQQTMLFNDDDYISINTQLEQLVQAHLLRIVKPQIEGTEQGRELLTRVQETLQVVKRRVQEQTSKEMEEFRRWQSFSAANPNATYAEFINATNIKKGGKK